MKLPQFFFRFSDRLSGIVPNSPSCLDCWIAKPIISFEPYIRSSVQLINCILDGHTNLAVFEFWTNVLVKYFPRSVISILTYPFWQTNMQRVVDSVYEIQKNILKAKGKYTMDIEKRSA